VNNAERQFSGQSQICRVDFNLESLRTDVIDEMRASHASIARQVPGERIRSIRNTSRRDAANLYKANAALQGKRAVIRYHVNRSFSWGLCHERTDADDF